MIRYGRIAELSLPLGCVLDLRSIAEYRADAADASDWWVLIDPSV